jgi:hypothetical protein
MQQQDENYQQAKQERKRISLWLIVCLGTLSILGFLTVIMVVICPLPTPSHNAGTATEPKATQSSDNTTKTTRLDVAQLLENPKYDTKVTLYGKVSLLGEADSSYFELTSGSKKVKIWYDTMVEDNGTKRPSINVKDIKNGDWVVITGELKQKGKYRSLNDFWASSIEKLK